MFQKASIDLVPGKSRAQAPNGRFHPANMTEMFMTIKMEIALLLLPLTKPNCMLKTNKIKYLNDFFLFFSFLFSFFS